MPRMKDLSGLTVNNVKLLTQTQERSSSNKIQYECLCLVCNKTFIAIGNNVMTGSTKNCRVCGYVSTTTHNMCKTKFYQVWAVMKYRCLTDSKLWYEDYKGRGISVCERWLSFENFYEDMYSSYKEGLSIDRINNDLGYWASNCKWSTKTEQCLNRRKPKSNTSSIYRNVSKTSKNRWRACLTSGYEPVYNEYFATEVEAAQAVDAYIKEHKLKHKLNFKESQDDIRSK